MPTVMIEAVLVQHIPNQDSTLLLILTRPQVIHTSRQYHRQNRRPRIPTHIIPVSKRCLQQAEIAEILPLGTISNNPHLLSQDPPGTTTTDTQQL